MKTLLCSLNALYLDLILISENDISRTKMNVRLFINILNKISIENVDDFKIA